MIAYRCLASSGGTILLFEKMSFFASGPTLRSSGQKISLETTARSICGRWQPPYARRRVVALSHLRSAVALHGTPSIQSMELNSVENSHWVAGRVGRGGVRHGVRGTLFPTLTPPIRRLDAATTSRTARPSSLPLKEVSSTIAHFPPSCPAPPRVVWWVLLLSHCRTSARALAWLLASRLSVRPWFCLRYALLDFYIPGYFPGCLRRSVSCRLSVKAPPPSCRQLSVPRTGWQTVSRRRIRSEAPLCIHLRSFYWEFACIFTSYRLW